MTPTGETGEVSIIGRLSATVICRSADWLPTKNSQNSVTRGSSTLFRLLERIPRWLSSGLARLGAYDGEGKLALLVVTVSWGCDPRDVYPSSVDRYRIDSAGDHVENNS